MATETNPPGNPNNSGSTFQAGKYTVLYNEWNREYKERPTRGFNNPGFLCFRNAVITSLLHVPVFVNWLELHRLSCESKESESKGKEAKSKSKGKESKDKKTEEKPKCLSCPLALLAEEYWSEREETDVLFRLMEEFWSECKSAGWKEPDEQHDVEEFMTRLIQLLKATGSGTDRSLEHIFDGVFIEKTSCSSCEYTKETPERDILTATRPAPTQGRKKWDLEKGIRAYAVKNNRAKCPQCRNYLKPRRVVIREAPEVLIVKINRVVNVNGQLQKYTDDVSFDETLVLTEYLESTTVDGGQGLAYQLVAVASHTGETTIEGHYISFAKSPDGTWTRLNDEDSEMVEFKQVLAQRQDEHTKEPFTPYLLTYQRIAARPQAPSPAGPELDASGGFILQPLPETTGGAQDANTNAPAITPANINTNNDQPDNQVRPSAAPSDIPPPAEEGAVTESPKPTTYPNSGFRWEGQPAEIMVQVTMGDMVLKGVLKGVLRKSYKRAAPDDEADEGSQHSSKRARVSPPVEG